MIKCYKVDQKFTRTDNMLCWITDIIITWEGLSVEDLERREKERYEGLIKKGGKHYFTMEELDCSKAQNMTGRIRVMGLNDKRWSNI